MGWTGKIVGGVLGSFLGPWGAAIGVGIGHQFDKGAERQKEISMVLQVAFFSCLAKMAKADGKVSQDEIRVVEEIIRSFGYSPQMREAAINIFREAKESQHTAEEYLEQLAAVINYNPQLALVFLRSLLMVAVADNRLHASEREILLQAERIFRLPAGTVDSLLGRGTGTGGNAPRLNEIEEAYTTLGCSPDMSDEEIKKIYRRKCLDFHPDTLASKGLPQEFMDYANQQLAKINNAYDTIRRHRA